MVHLHEIALADAFNSLSAKYSDEFFQTGIEKYRSFKGPATIKEKR